MNSKIIKFLAYNGKVSVICADTTELVEKARITHDLSPVATAAFGRMLTITSIMAVEMKNRKDKLINQSIEKHFYIFLRNNCTYYRHISTCTYPIPVS